MAYLTWPGTRLFYEREGTGNPPLVFVHGFACAHDDWQAQLDFFRARQCVAAFDLRGHGASPGDPAQCDIETYGADVNALLHALELTPAILIGHSLGCRAVLQACSEAPQRVAGLVLVDGSRMATGDPQLPSRPFVSTSRRSATPRLCKPSLLTCSWRRAIRRSRSA